MDELIKVSQLPIIEENLRAIASTVDEKVRVATSLVCTEDTVKEVKAARNELNNKFKELEAQRKAVKTAVLNPYNKFEAVYKECVSDKFKAADEVLKGKIQEVEKGLKNEKEKEVRKFFEDYKTEKGLDWLNYEQTGISITLSASNKKLKEQVRDFIDSTVSAVEVIGYQEYSNEILIEYQKTLDLQYSIRTVIERKERLKAMQAKENKESEPEKAEPVKVKPVTMEDILDMAVDSLCEPEKITFVISNVPKIEAKRLRGVLSEMRLLWEER